MNEVKSSRTLSKKKTKVSSVRFIASIIFEKVADSKREIYIHFDLSFSTLSQKSFFN